MHIPSGLISLATRALSESMDVDVMTSLAREIIFDYDLYRATGFRDSMVITRRDAARQIVPDIVRAGLFQQLVSILIQFHTDGYKGRNYPINHLKDILRELNGLGYIYDKENKLFVEDPANRRTRNWGALTEGQDYPMAFLRLDIVGNSQLVRKYPENIIRATYADLKKIVDRAIDKRNGRIWSWEGDGGLVAFYFSDKSLLAALSGMEIINELFIYNTLYCTLGEPLKIRLAVHFGICEYTKDPEELMKNDIIKETVQIESKHTKPNSMTLSNTVCPKLDASLRDSFKPVSDDPRLRYCSYSIELEQ